MQEFISLIAGKLSLPATSISSTVQLLDGGATIPFISRYRKEQTGSLDEVQIANIRDELNRLRELEKRREAILKSIKEQEKLTPELEKKIREAETVAKLEDLYLPYKPKRRTRATIAIEKGLEPLAKVLFEQKDISPEKEAEKFISKEKEVESAEDALKGARDIIAEWVNQDAEAREKIRKLFREKAVIKSKVITGKEQEGQKFRDYFEWEEPLKNAPSHRVLALRRGEKEMILNLEIQPDAEEAVFLLEKQFVEAENPAGQQVKEAVNDAYNRLMKFSMETEMRVESKKKADEKAIAVFADNLRELLLAPPLGEKTILALDPGFRTGCKVVVLNKQGRLMENTAIFPNEPQKKTAESEAVIRDLVNKFQVEAIAIGNGTASRETESFIRGIKDLKGITVVVVNESGASVYSASEVAREEFPDQDVTVRGAVSIGRRLSDPLAELVKIDAKSIGVGQYQHDVSQSELKKSLDDVVVSCVNAVGVELNTASKQLLTYVSGLGPKLAENIIKFRNENGAFPSRKAIKKVSGMGEKAFEQCAGFLRIADSEQQLDKTAVHPESYGIVEKMASDAKASVNELIANSELRKQIKPQEYVTDTAGLPTIKDILAELEKPGRDPRKQFEAFSFKEGVENMEDLKPGMKLPGIVTNVTNFGAFVDIGVHQDGLVHVSHMADKFVSDPSEIVKVSQQVQVTVLDVDIPRKRISLSLKSDPFGDTPKPQKKRSKAKKPKDNGGDMQAKLEALKGKFGSN